MAASKWPCSFQEEETVGTTHRRTPHDDRRRPMSIGNLKYIHTTCNRCYLQYLWELCKIGIKFILDGSLEWQFGLVLPKHSFLRSLDFSCSMCRCTISMQYCLLAVVVEDPRPLFSQVCPEQKRAALHTQARGQLSLLLFPWLKYISEIISTY